MDLEAGTLEAFYASPIQHPVLLWLATGIAIAFCLSKRGLSRSLRRYCVVLAILSFADAWLTSSRVFGLGTLQGWLASGVPLFFVLAGDYRYLFFVLAATAGGEIEPRVKSFLVAAGLTAVVPILSQVALLLLPDSVASARMLFLIYEVGFIVLTLSLMRWHPKIRCIPWIRSVSRFVVLYYSLWAGADLLILTTGLDLGYGLRVVPNLLYYGGLIATFAWFAPGEPAPPAK